MKGESSLGAGMNRRDFRLKTASIFVPSRFAPSMIVPAFCFFLTAAVLPAQDAEPEDPGIVLPPTLLEVEDLQVEEIDAIIPDEDIQLLPEIDIPLPQAEEIFLPEERFDIPYPDQLAVIPGGADRPQRSANIFSEGEIAVGSMSHVRGDLTLYRLGPDPRFDLRFYHDKIDGYGMRSAGSGFYRSDDLLEGSISYTSGEIDINTAAGISEHSDGLQRIGEYESLTFREVYAEGEVVYPLTESFSVSGAVSPRYNQQILSSMDPEITDEFKTDVGIGLDWRTRFVDLNPSIGYTLLNRKGLTHTLGFSLLSLLKINEAVNFELTAGVKWLELLDFYFPFSLAGSWQPSDSFVFEAGGGYFVEQPGYDQLYDEYTFIDVSTSPVNEYGWFSYADTQVRLLGDLFIAAEADFKYFDVVNVVVPDYSATTGLYALEKQTALPRLQTSLGLRYNIEREFDFTLSWNGRFIGNHPFTPPHALNAGFAYRQPEDAFGAQIDFSMPLAGGYSYIPELGLSAYYRLAESVRLSLYLVDPLAPLISGGRIDWAPFEAPGFQVFLGTDISL